MTSTPRARRFWPILLVVLLATLPFVPSLGNGFPFDDTLASPQTADRGVDPVISELHAPWHYFGLQYWAGGDRESRLYRPVTILSYAWTHHFLSVPLCGPDGLALPHHLLNLLLNAWAAVLVLLLLRDLRVGLFGATLTAGLFAVHALHSEVVAGIVGRAELFSFCFGAWGLRLLCRAGPTPLRLAVAAVAFFLAFGSKESSLAWVPFVPCYLMADAWLRGQAAGARLREMLGPMLWVLGPSVALFFVLRTVAIAGMTDAVFYAANPLYHQDLWVRWMSAIKIWGYGLYKCVAPFSLAASYGPPTLGIVTSPADAGFLASLAILLAALGIALVRARRAPRLFLAAALFFGFSFITSNVPVAIGTVFGERLYFIPSLGVCMLPALAWPHLGLWARRVTLGICVLWAAACIVVDLQRSAVWKDNVTLMIHDAAAQPRCASLQIKAATMHQWLARPDTPGDGQTKEFHREEAQRLLRLGRTLDPDYVSGMAAEASFLAEAEDFDGAIRVLQAALASPRLSISGLEAGLQADLGMLLIQEKKRVSQGLRHLQRAVELKPGNRAYRAALMEHGIGVLPGEQLRPALIQGIEMFPKDVIWQVFQAAFVMAYAERNAANHGQVAEMLGRVFQVVPDAALKDRRYLQARVLLGDALLTLGRRDAARDSYQRAVAAGAAHPDLLARARRGLAQAQGKGR